jgi:CMP-N,N'-diacetyllegionaminic acid synthase
LIKNQRVVAVIPARGGSKSIPRKNLQPLRGLPLIAWTIEIAKTTPEIDRVIVSTDDDEISDIARSHGAEVYKRPENLATDTSLVGDAIRDLYKKLVYEGEKADIIVLLEPTCPIRPDGLVSLCLSSLVESKSDSIATFSQLSTSPDRIWKIEENVPSLIFDGSNPWMPRQALRVGYEINGAVYAFYPKHLPESHPGLLFGKAKAFIMEQHVIDIDTYEDLAEADAIIKNI